MSILSYKYKAHKFINYAFYAVVFIVGFLLGFASDKINYNKLINQVLMIDNVSALNVTHSGVNYTEEYIYNIISSRYSDFSIEEYPYIIVDISKNKSKFSFLALSEEAFNNATFQSITSYQFQISLSNTTSGNFIYNTYQSGSYTYSFTTHSNNANNINKISVTTYVYSSDSYSVGYTNFNVPKGNDTLNSKVNLLDFSEYLIPNYKLNDGSIFEDENHLDFNKVCWENFDELMFSITIDNNYNGSYNVKMPNQQDGETYVKSGFYVFDDITNLKRGTRIKALGSFDYDKYASTWLSGATFNHLENITDSFYFMKSDELLQNRYSNVIDALGNYDIERGDSYYFDNLNKLKNAHYVDFTYYYNVIDDFKYDIFYLKEKKDNFCIYVPKTFIVTTLSINELGGFIGDIPIHNDKSDSFIDMTETTGKLHFNNLFSVINQFIESIRDTINLINSYIYSFFLSLPPLVQMFIYTIITLIVIKTIIWMVVK